MIRRMLFSSSACLGAAAEGEHANVLGAAARLGEASLVGLPDLDPLDDAAGEILLPQLGLFGIPHGSVEAQQLAPAAA